MNIYANTIKGSKHRKNEDSFFISEDLKMKGENFKLLLVLDGISSYGNASTLTHSFTKELENVNQEHLFKATKETFNFIDIKLINALNDISKIMESGTTLSLVIIEQNTGKILTMNLGDSPIFLIRNNIVFPIYGDCSAPVFHSRDYTKLSKINIKGNVFYPIKPLEEIEYIMKGIKHNFNCNMILSSLPYKTSVRNGHLYKFQSKVGDIIMMGSDGFLANYYFPDLKKRYASMANQIKLGGQGTLDNFIKLHSYHTEDDSTGICVTL